jgi:hypothetical protein
LLGSLSGLGGGVILVPMLTLGFGVDIRYAIGASLVSVIATSSGSAVAYVRQGYTNIRIGMLLEVATMFCAVIGAFVAAIAPIAQLPNRILQMRLTLSNGETQTWHLSKNTVEALKELVVVN